MSVTLADRLFQYPVGTAKNMLVEVGKFTFFADFVILEMEEDSNVPLILGQPFLHTVDEVIRVKQKQLNLGVGNERMIFNIDSAMKHSYLNDDTRFNIDVIDEILEEDFDALLDEDSKILHSIEGTLLKEEIFAEFDEFMAMTVDENFDSESDTEEPPFERITINTNYKIKTSLEEPLTDLEHKPLPDNLEYVFPKEPSFLHIQLLDDKKPVVQKQRRLNLNMQEVVKKEIVKLLDSGIIDPIADSAWVSPIHCVPKKGGITVITNENEKLVPTRTVTSWKNVTSWSKKELCLDTRFDDECQKEFELLKEKLTCAPVIVSPNWNLPFELMCDASDFADRKGTENVAADHLSRIKNDEISDDSKVDDNFPGETIMEINTKDKPWFADFANYLVDDVIPKGMTYQQKNNFFSDLKHYFWEEPYLFKECYEDMYDSWKSRMELYMMNKQHGRMILESVENGPLIWPTVEENGVTRPNKYSELSTTETIQADRDVKETNIILQGLPPEVYALVSNHKVAKELWERIQLLMQGTSLTKQERECKIYDEFDKFAYKKRESLRDLYLRFSLLLNDMNIYNMKLEQFQVNTKFLNTFPPEWSKFIIDVKLIRDLHTTNVDQLHAYLRQHEYHANEVHLMHERNSDPLSLVANHQMTKSPYQTHQQSYQHTQFQPQVSSFQSSQFGSPYHSSYYESHAQTSTPLSITYPSNNFQSSVHHNVYNPSSSIHQVEYAQSVHQQSNFSQPDTGLVVPVFQKGDDPIVAINHMMSFLTAIVSSQYPLINNQLRNSSNPRQQATINNGRVTVQPIQGRQILWLLGEGHMSKQCTKPKRKRDEAWFKDMVLLIALMANLSHYGSDNLAENLSFPAQQDDLILSVIEQLKTQVVNCTKINQDNKNVNEILTAELERYKDQVRILKERNNVDKASDSCAQSLEIDNLKHTLSEHLKENESLEQMTVHMLSKPQFFYDHSTRQALSFQNPCYLKKAQQLEPKLYDGSVIQKTNAIVIRDSEETLMLEDESPEQVFWSQNSVNSEEPNLSTRPTLVEVPKELPKVNMVNSSLKKLKFHLASFDVVVKERTTATTITEGTWGFKHTKACFKDEIIPFVKALKDLLNSFDQILIDELFEVQNVFNQMEQAVEQHRVETNRFQDKMKDVLKENE
uniref:Reverse transcriptase domain-containing protein n=1 Tax=Tanacetum cinerariifolium TaxID=118510 RepID=A0A6L2L9H7_TANCI|nr:reverse transcriptase domain-containing protein [Tanacetum cinerariifolium]